MVIAGHRGPLAAETGKGLLYRVARDIRIVGHEGEGAGEGFVLIHEEGLWLGVAAVFELCGAPRGSETPAVPRRGSSSPARFPSPLRS